MIVLLLNFLLLIAAGIIVQYVAYKLRQRRNTKDE